MFFECLDRLPETLGDFSPAAAYGDRDRWTSLPDRWKQLLAERAQTAGTDWPLLTASDYLEFTRNGNRTRFEAKFMERRRMLNAYALAECSEGKGRHIDRIIDGALLLCEESGWQLPAHNTYIRDTPCLPLPDARRPVIDLFAAETGAQLATLNWLFAAEFDRVSPFIAARIQDEIERRIITPYLNAHFWWMGNGDEPMNNWTAWCTQNVLLATFTSATPADVRRAVVKKAAYSLDCFLKEYGEDGACEEGVLYYRHAGLCLFNALNILSAVAPEAFAPLWQNTKIRNIAEFILFMHVDGERYFNFNDSSARAGRCGAREYLFGKAVGSSRLMQFAARDIALSEAPDLPEEINLFYRLQTAMTAIDLPDTPPEMPAIPDHFFESLGLLVARDQHFALAVKAGDNGDSHNHNDVGSFTLYKDNKPFLIDIGVENYTAKTFSARRYEIWTMQSGFHNLPAFDGIDQKDGVEYAASDVAVTLKDDLAAIAMELAGAWPDTAQLRSYHRAVLFHKGQGIDIEDRFDGDRPAVLSLLFASEPQLGDALITLPGLGEIAISGASAMRLEPLDITDSRLRAAWPARLFRVLLPLSGNTLRLAIR
ncbi:heparinase II/III family protein [Martelella sp. HB161492]|uniref:heparinase II/III domain-containing protein n=1 Tax=Martelella sp. HB161492 TaxID=2720726 RepID=UPI001590A6F1|nr:heparinase II/III family protein [Martelella sp. HB161492]